MEAVTVAAERMGAQCTVSEEGLFVQAPVRPKSIGHLQTGPYPEFPTDLQSAAMAVLTMAEGISYIEENISRTVFELQNP